MDARGWDRLGVGDLIAMWVEDRSTAMNIALAGVLDPDPLLDSTGRIRLTEARAAVAARLDRVPALRRRMHRTRVGQGRPVWSDDGDFDVTGHVHTVDLPGADTDAFLTWAASWAACRLDRDRPLWRIAFVGGLASGQVGVVVVVHHALADGVAGAALAAALLDAAVGETPPPSRWRPSPPPTSRELVRDAAATRLAELRRLVARLGRHRAHRSDVRETLAALRSSAPDLHLPAPAGEARVTAAVGWPLEQVHALAHAHEATVNDVMLAVVAAGMRELLAARGLPTRDLVLRVSVPVAGAPGSRNAGGTTPLVLPLPVGDADPVAVLHDIAGTTRRAKTGRDRDYPGVFAAPLMPLMLVRLGVAWMARHSVNKINLYVTNVPGPRRPLWFAGARLRTAYPLPPLIAGVPLAVGVLSYAGALTLTATAAPGVPVAALTAGARAAMTSLDTAAAALTSTP